MLNILHLSLALLLLISASGCAYNENSGTSWFSTEEQTEAATQGHASANSIEQQHGDSSFFISALMEKIDKRKLPINFGMGVAIFSDNNKCVILTNKHLIKDSTAIAVRSWSGKPCQGDSCQESIQAKLIDESPLVDAALIEIEKSGGCSVSNITETEPAIGTSIAVFGQPQLGMGAMNKGIVSAFWKMDQGVLIVSDVLTTYGYSGSGVFDEKNNLIGLVIGKTIDENRGFAYALPFDNTFLTFLQKSTLFTKSKNFKK